MAHFIITGGGGYIGKHLAYELSQDPENTITLIDIDFSKIPNTLQLDNTTLIKLDLTDRNKTLTTVSRLIKEIDDTITVFHLAGIADARNEPLGVQINKNTITLKNMVDACVMEKDDVTGQCMINKFIFASTSMIYYNPDSAYAKSKLYAEEYLQKIALIHDLSACIYRIFNVTGEHQSHIIWEDHTPETHLIPNLFKLYLGYDQYAKITVYSKPVFDATLYISPVRSYIDVMDVVQAFIYGSMNTCITNKNVPIWDIHTDKFNTIFEVIQMISGIVDVDGTGMDLEIVDWNSVQDTFKPYGGERLKGWTPFITLEESLINYMEGMNDRIF